MKEKMSTFTAMDILGCHLYWINLNVKNLKEHLKTLEHLIEKFEIEKDYNTDAYFLIMDYVSTLRFFINDTEYLNKQVKDYLKGRGISNMTDDSDAPSGGEE
jgi:hypothetical protein